MFQILIIDDDLIVQMVLKKTLLDQGYEVIVAKSGEDGLAQARKHYPALIICDWMMPGMDGLEVCRQVKQDRSLSTTFFILLTSRGELEDRVRGLDNGADDFLAKPIEVTELTARVRAGLRLYQLNQDLQAQKQLLQEQKQLLESELSEAAEYVRSLLPKPLNSTIQIDAEFIPSSQLGGDCFDYYWLDADRLVVYLLDISGHGVGAALLSISVLNLLRSQSLSEVDLSDPRSVMAELNRKFQMNQHGGKYFTMWYGVYNKAKQRLIYASAGHPPALLISQEDSTGNARVQKLESLSMPVGFFPDASFTNDECCVEPGSRLYVFSDGVYEIKQDNSKRWGLDQFIELLTTPGSNGKDAKDIKQVVNYIQQVNGSSHFDDDVSLLQVNFN